MRVLIWGPPGSGKTAVGRELANMLNFKFIDTDEVVEKEAGKSIPQIFRDEGEDWFRYIEKKVLLRVLDKDNVVVALGGGTLTFPENMHIARERGTVVCLTASVQKLLERIGEGSERPLLSGDPRGKLERILAERREIYKVCDFSVSTDEGTPRDIAREICSLLERMKRFGVVRVNLFDRSYDIIVGEDALSDVCARRFSHLGIKKVLVVTSKKIAEIELDGEKALDRVGRFFRSAGASEIYTLFLAEGERTKSLSGAKRIWDALARHKFSKSDAIAVLGGGVLGDTAGFCAGTWARGIYYFQIPTTLLAQVDSAIGGKTAVNIPSAKNMIGIIYQPRGVVAELRFVASLPDVQFRSGLGEVFKYALSLSPSLFDILFSRTEKVLRRDFDVLREIVTLSAHEKAKIVSSDEFERKGDRMILNFGHTIAHAVESATRFRIPHGLAVALGCLVESKICDMLSGSEVFPRALELERKLGLCANLKIKLKFDDISGAIMYDKKIRGGRINFPLVREPGSWQIVAMDIERFLELARSAWNETVKILGR